MSKWHIKRVLILQMVLDIGLLHVLTVYAPHSAKLEEEKESFLFHFIPQNEMVVLAADMNRHDGHDGTRGGFGYGDRNADGSRILELQMG